MHRARWLSKAIYCWKIFLFRRVFGLTTRKTDNLRHICIFVLNFYVKACFTAPNAIAAPHHDLKLLRNLILYEQVNAEVPKAAREKMARHLWYLSEELAALAFFDDAVSLDTKAKMVHAIKSRENEEEALKRVIVRDADLLSWIDKDVSDFITQKSLVLFDQFDLYYDFLNLNPELWPDNEAFNRGYECFYLMKVVNDVAERGVALIQQ